MEEERRRRHNQLVELLKRDKKSEYDFIVLTRGTTALNECFAKQLVEASYAYSRGDFEAFMQELIPRLRSLQFYKVKSKKIVCDGEYQIDVKDVTENAIKTEHFDKFVYELLCNV